MIEVHAPHSTMLRDALDKATPAIRAGLDEAIKSAAGAALHADPIDIHVGARIRDRRKALKLSQSDLGDHLDLTFQQVQKYERGANRVSASMLYKAAAKLKVDIGFFFAGLDAYDTDPAAADRDVVAFLRDPVGREAVRRLATMEPEIAALAVDLAKSVSAFVNPGR